MVCVVEDAQDRFTEYEFTGTQQVKKTVYRGTSASAPKLEATTTEFNLQGRTSRTVVTKYGPNGVDPASQEVYEFQYDGSGLRIAQTVNGVRTTYLLDLANPTGYAQVLEEKDAAGNVTKTYTLGHDVLAQATASQVLYLLTDGHGSTRAVVDLAALLANPQNPAVAILQRFAYDAYGSLLAGANLTAELSAALTSYLYSGEQTDRTGLQYLRARYYDPTSGRFASLDPFFGNLEDPLSLHKYAYVHGDPVNGVDPTGEFLLPLLPAILYAINIGFVLYDAYQLVDSLRRGSEDSGRHSASLALSLAVLAIPGAGPWSRGGMALAGGATRAAGLTSLELLKYGAGLNIASHLATSAALWVSSGSIHLANGPQDFSNELNAHPSTARSRLSAALGPGAGQAHHIITWAARTHELIVRAARGGFNINGANNGVRILTHTGPHPRYNDAIRNWLDDKLSRNPTISDTDAAIVVQAYVNRLEPGLRLLSKQLR